MLFVPAFGSAVGFGSVKGGIISEDLGIMKLDAGGIALQVWRC